jgi:sugar phosphate isomerase/epimerase
MVTPLPPPPLAVFVKPWPEPLELLAARVAAWGVEGIELPVRPGFPVTPDNAAMALPAAVRLFKNHGLEIFSVAGDPDEALIHACAAAGVRLIRLCPRVPVGMSYPQAEAGWKRHYTALVPALEATGVTLGLQNHCDEFLPHAMALRDLCSAFDPRHVAAVWDAAHAALSGEPPDIGLDLVQPCLRMVNLKNACWRRVNRPEAEVADWRIHWAPGPEGIASWPRVARELARRRYAGPVCLTAEYSDHDATDRLIGADIPFARRLLAETYSKIGDKLPEVAR